MRNLFLLAAAAVALAACNNGSDRTSNNAALDNPAVPATNANAAIAAVSGAEAERIAHVRHEGMEAIGKATKAIGQQLKSPSADLAVIRTSAERIEQLAGEATGWFPAGTGRDAVKTRALPDIWQKPEDFAAKLKDFQQAATALRTAAQSGQLSEINARFDALGKSCKACHDPYRAPEH